MDDSRLGVNCPYSYPQHGADTIQTTHPYRVACFVCICATCFVAEPKALLAHAVPDEQGQQQQNKDRWEQALQDTLALEAKLPKRAQRREHPALLRGVNDPEARLAIYREAITWFGSDPPAGFDAWPKDVYERRDAAKAALLYAGDEAWPVIVQAYRQPDASLRWSTIELLEARGRAALDILHDLALKSPKSDTRSRAISAIRKIEAPESVPVLIEALKSPDRGVVIRAAWALRDFRDPAALEPLAEVLKRDNISEHGWYSVCDAMMAIDADFSRPIVVPYAQGIIGRTPNDENNRQLLLKRANQPRYPKGRPIGIPKELEPARVIAADAFRLAGESYGEDEIKQLIASLNHIEPDIGRATIDALLHLQAREAIPHLIRAVRQEAVNSGNHRMQFRALAVLGGEEALRELANACRAAGQGNRELYPGSLSAPYALKELGTSAVPLMMVMLDDQHFARQTIEIRNKKYIVRKHRILSMLGDILQTSKTINPTNQLGEPAFIDPTAQIASMKAWWAGSRDAYLAGNSTPPPPEVELYRFDNTFR